MRRSKHQQLEPQALTPSTALAKSLGPEDIRRGDFVTPLQAIAELPSFLWCADATTLPLHEPVRFEYVPRTAGIPLKVKSVCLPFVLVAHPFGKRQTLDVRQCRLARLDREYAKVSWKAFKKKKASKSNRK